LLGNLPAAEADHALEGISGFYFSDCNPATPSPQARDAILAERLWKVSEDLVKGYL